MSAGHQTDIHHAHGAFHATCTCPWTAGAWPTLAAAQLHTLRHWDDTGGFYVPTVQPRVGTE